MEGTLIDGKYEVLRQLGEGGMGAVYEARHRATGRLVAVKVIVPAALAGGLDIIARFEREARASGSIASPFVVQVLDAGVDPATGAPYMAMECLTGEDVQHLIARLGPLPPHVVLRITAHACHGLQKAHDAGIVHRDIKSANLFLSKREGDAHELITKILDFGIAKVRASPMNAGEDHKLTKTGSMLGSPVYMSPEQAVGAKDLDARSDVFSMGVMMYEALSGATPNGHLDNLGALLMAICSRPAQALQDRAPWVSAEIAAVVHKALELNPADRYQSAEELRAAAIALLPSGGTTIVDEMVVALTPEAKSHRAQRKSAPQPASALAATVLPPTSSASSPQLRGLSESGSDPRLGGALAVAGDVTGGAPMTTTAGLGTSHRAQLGLPNRSPLAAVAIGLGLLAFAVGGGGVYYAKFRAPRAELATGLSPAASSPWSVASAPSSAAPTENVRTENVVVSPADASVEVDGKSVRVVTGRFEVTGAVGSVHDVRIRSGGAEKRFDIVLAATGPIPPLVELPPRSAGAVAQTGAGRAGAAAKPATPSSPASPVVAPVSPPPVLSPPPAPAPAPKKETGMGIDRNQ